MKLGIIAATALAVVAMPAVSQHVVERRTVIQHDEHRRGPVVVRTVHRRQVCTVRWVHHQKVRRCR